MNILYTLFMCLQLQALEDGWRFGSAIYCVWLWLINVYVELLNILLHCVFPPLLIVFIPFLFYTITFLFQIYMPHIFVLCRNSLNDREGLVALTSFVDYQ